MNRFSDTGITNLRLNTLLYTAGGLDKASVLFEYLFKNTDSLTEKNKVLFIFLEDNIRRNDLNTINRFINDDAINDLHKSLLKSCLLMVENLQGVSTERILTIYAKRKLLK